MTTTTTTTTTMTMRRREPGAGAQPSSARLHETVSLLRVFLSPCPSPPLRLRLSRERPVTLHTHCLASASIHMRLHAPRDCLGCTAHPSTHATSGPLAWQMCASGGLLCAVVLRAWRSVLYRWHSLLFRDRRRQSSGCWFIGVMARLSLPDPGEYQRARWRHCASGRSVVWCVT